MATPFLGEIKLFAGNFAPTGYALCDGLLLDISQNQALFALLGTTYGGNGTSTFALPDLRGRVPVHQGQGPGLSARAMGQTLGAEQVSVTQAQMPLHNHAQQASSDPVSGAAGPGAAPGNSASTAFYGASPRQPMAPQAVSLAGGGQPHDNMAPFNTLNFIIALQGLFPSRN